MKGDGRSPPTLTSIIFPMSAKKRPLPLCVYSVMCPYLYKTKKNIKLFITWKTFWVTRDAISYLRSTCPFAATALWIMFNLCSVQFHLFTLYESDIFQSGEKFQLCCQFFPSANMNIYLQYIHSHLYLQDGKSPLFPPFQDWILIMQIQYVHNSLW